ncbi:hypothetical protein BGZ74_010905 [Mortierella antarctica]|nr:hypothetical protein BGZ74_010905 [Mortierella antarctica]
MGPLTIPELLSTVCNHLDRPSLLSASLVSRFWSVVCKPLIWQQFSFTAERYNVNHTLFDDNAHLIRSMDAKRRLIGGDMRFIAQQCVNLRVLKLINCRMTPASFDVLCDGIPQVHSMTLEYCLGVNSRMASKVTRLTHLSSLSIMVHAQERGEGDWREDDMVLLLARSPLQSLHILGPDLSHVHLRGLGRSSESLQLTHLYLVSTFISHNALAVLLQKSPCLATLVLLHNAIKNTTVQTIAENCTTLAHLGLQQAKSVTTTGFESVFRKTQWLKCLDISFTLIQDSAVAALARHCPKLQVLNMSHCTRLTHVGLWELLRSLSDLQDLCVSGCIKLKVEGVSGKEAWACQGSLEILDISHIGLRVGLDPLNVLISHLLSLRRLRVLRVDEGLFPTDLFPYAKTVNISPASIRDDDTSQSQSRA